MANIIKYPGAAFPFSFARQNSAPLDNTAVLATLSDLNTYAANLDKSYVPYRGLIISCEETNAAYILISESGKLVPKKIASDLPPLTDYATKLWVIDKGYWIDVPTLRSQWNEAYNLRHSHANKLALDGIILTDISSWNNAGLLAHDHANKTVLDTITSLSTSNWNQVFGWGNHGDLAYAKQAITITAGSGLTGGGNLSANRTISLSNSGVLSGTYTKLNVDVYGRVTSGTTLILADIPTLSISKVSGLQQALDGSLGQEVFNDMFEKVNVGTVESPSYVIKAKYGFFSVGEVSAYGSGGSGGDGGTGLIQTVYSYPQLGGSFSDTTLTDTFNAYTINKIYTDFTNHSHTFASLTSKPTTLGGYGITDSVLNTDIRLTNARPASDVYAWAKAVNKPSYSYNEITGTPPVVDLSNYVKKTGDSMSGQLSLTVPKGTSPLLITSDTLVNNLNVQYLNGQLGSYYTSYADSAVAGVVVGGRNYYKKDTPYNSQNTAAIFTRIPSINGFQLTGAADVTKSEIRLSHLITSLGYWTVSFEFKGTQGAPVGFQLDICDRGAKYFYNPSTTNEWLRAEYTVAVTLHSDSTYHFVDFEQITRTYIDIRNFKVEKGNKATDWTAAPEDVQSEIDKKLNLTGGVLTGTITAPSFIKSGGTSTQLLRADGGITEFKRIAELGQPTEIWGVNTVNDYRTWNPANFRVYYSSYTGRVETHDIRGVITTPIGKVANSITSWFNNADVPNYDWNSGICVTGWSSDYESWELAGPSSGSNTQRGLYYRSGIKSSWNNWQKIITDSNWTSIVDGRYLPLTGGIMTTGAKIIISSSDASDYGGAFEIRERDYVLNTQSDWEYAPKLTFHWGMRNVKLFGLRYDGKLAVNDQPISLDGHTHAYLPLAGGTLSGDVLSTGFFRTTAWFQNNISGLGLYNAAEDAYWHAQDGYWNASKQIRVNGSLVWNAGNDGSGSGLDADLLDGVHGGGYLLNQPGGAGSNLDLNDVNKIFIGPGYGVTNSPFPGDQGVISIPTWNSYGKYAAQFVAQLGNYNLCYRTTNVYGEGAWKYVAFIDSNVSSATKLQTSRTIWGQSFDGSAVVSGALSGATTGLFSGQVTAGGVYSNGNIVATGEVSAYSDRRLKSNIRSLDNRGRLSAKTFLKDNKQLIGFIALDVLELYPELISTTFGPELYLSLNYGAITAVLSIQINDVEDEVSILKLKVKQLENKIKQYEEINF